MASLRIGISNCQWTVGGIHLDCSLCFSFHRLLLNKSHHLTFSQAEEWCKENSKPESEILDARLAPDMLDFAFQVRMTRHMTESGILSADWHWVPYNQELEDEKSFAGLRDALQKQIVRLEGVKREDVEGGESRVCDVWTLGECLHLISIRGMPS